MSTGAQGLVGLVENIKFFEMLILDSGIYAQSSFLLKACNMKDPSLIMFYIADSILGFKLT